MEGRYARAVKFFLSLNLCMVSEVWIEVAFIGKVLLNKELRR